MDDYEDTLNCFLKHGPFFSRWGQRDAHGYEYNYLFYHCPPPKYGHPPPPLEADFSLFQYNS